MLKQGAINNYCNIEITPNECVTEYSNRYLMFSDNITFITLTVAPFQVYQY
jgi:hypothetical protein